jgi:hypothetical protein
MSDINRGLPMDTYFSYSNDLVAKNLSMYRSNLPSFFYPDQRGGAVDPENNYWYKYGILPRQDFDKRNPPKDKWVYFSYSNSSHLQGFDTRETTVRTLSLKFSYMTTRSILISMAVCSAYASYIGAPLFYAANGSRLLKSLELLKLELNMQKNR